MPRWITWTTQSYLARLIRDVVDTGSTADYIVASISEDHPGLFPETEIRRELDWLLGICLLVSDDGYIKVTEYAHDTVMAALGAHSPGSWVECLRVLRSRGIWHPDMVQYGVATKEEAP